MVRHGARTPLTDKYWAGAEWNVCKDKCKSVKLIIEDINGGPQPASEYDAKQVSRRRHPPPPTWPTGEFEPASSSRLGVSYEDGGYSAEDGYSD